LKFKQKVAWCRKKKKRTLNPQQSCKKRRRNPKKKPYKTPRKRLKNLKRRSLMPLS
jgi:hypothetical protein